VLLKDDRASLPTIGEQVEQEKHEKTSTGIRCPLCGWRPKPSSRWCCDVGGTPEPPFTACGTIWNTFSTRGRCPGCDHQWQWTSCLACHRPSRHADWYETQGKTH
jgi:hypothetical protein